MKPNRLTAGSNVFWESSRMMIPQHKAAIILQEMQSAKRAKPELTEEEQEEMFTRLKVSKSNTLEVTITVFGEFEDQVITGIVTGLDPRQHLIKIESDYDWQLIKFCDVIRVELGDDYYPF